MPHKTWRSVTAPVPESGLVAEAVACPVYRCCPQSPTHRHWRERGVSDRFDVALRSRRGERCGKWLGTSESRARRQSSGMRAQIPRRGHGWLLCRLGINVTKQRPESCKVSGLPRNPTNGRGWEFASRAVYLCTPGSRFTRSIVKNLHILAHSFASGIYGHIYAWA